MGNDQGPNRRRERTIREGSPVQVELLEAEEHHCQQQCRRASVEQAIEFTFGAPYEVRRLDWDGARKAYPIALIGSQTFRRVELLMHGHIDAFTIVFQPGGLSTLFSVPADELTNNDFEGEAVLGRGMGELLRQLGDVSSFVDRALVAYTYLCAKDHARDSIS